MNSPKWHRVSVISLVHFFFTRGLRIIKELGFNAAPILVAGFVAVKDTSFWFGIFIIAFITILVTDTLISYWTFRFKITDDQLIVKQGFFTREVLNLKYDRIQNVNISEPWYFKPFRLVNCILDSAGSTAKEASIPGITESVANKIGLQIHSYQQEKNISVKIDDEEFPDSDVTKTAILKITNKEVTKYGFTNSMIFVIAAAFYPIVEKSVERLGWDFSAYLNNFAIYIPLPEFAAKVVILAASLILFGILLLSFTAVGSLIRFYNYELHNEPTKLKRIAGLLDRQQIAVRKHKIQGITIKQNIFAKLLNRVTLQFHQTLSELTPQSKKQHLIIPMLKPDEWQQYISWVFSDFSTELPVFNKISHHYQLRRSLIFFVIPITILSLYLSFKFSIYNLFILGLIPVGIFLVWLRYRRYGYYINDNHAIIRSGFIGVKYTVFPLYKLQKLIEKQSYAQRKRQLCSSEFQLAFGNISLPYISKSLANKIINLCLYKVESSGENWL